MLESNLNFTKETIHKDFKELKEILEFKEKEVLIKLENLFSHK